MEVDKRELWVRFFNATTRKELDEIVELDPTFDKVVNRLLELSADPEIIAQYEAEEKKRIEEDALEVKNLKEFIETKYLTSVKNEEEAEDFTMDM